MNAVDFSFLDSHWRDTETWFWSWGRFGSFERKSELEKTLEQSDINNVLYNIIRQESKKEIISSYKNAKRETLYLSVEKQVPILKTISIEHKKIDEYGAILPVLEEKQVNNPDDKNIRVHQIPAKKDVIRYKSIRVDEAQPPLPLWMKIKIPYGIYAVCKLEEEDKFYDVSRHFQHIRLLLNSIWEIQKQLWEQITVEISCEDKKDSEGKNLMEDKDLSDKEKQERSKYIFEWIQKHYQEEYPLSLEFNENQNTKGEKNRPVFWIQLTENQGITSIFDEKTWREYNKLVNILWKDREYFDLNSIHAWIKTTRALNESKVEIKNRCKEYIKTLFKNVY